MTKVVYSVSSGQCDMLWKCSIHCLGYIVAAAEVWHSTITTITNVNLDPPAEECRSFGARIDIGEVCYSKLPEEQM